MDGKLIRNCSQILRAFGPDDTPVSIPDCLQRSVSSGNSGAGAIGALRMKEFLAIEIADREVREIEVADIPCRHVRRITVHTFAEKSQFEAELASIRGSQ